MSETESDATAQPGPATEAWIKAQFQLEHTHSEYFPVFQRYFLRRISEVRDEFGVDPVTDHEALMEGDDDDVEPKTCRQFIEDFTHQEFGEFLRIRSEGFSVPYCEAYAAEVPGNDGRDDASIAALNRLAGDLPRTKGNPAYQEVLAACERLGKPPEFAHYCAQTVMDEDGEFSFDQALESTEKHFAAITQMTSRGHSELRGRLYAEALGLKLPEQFAEVYAESAEEQVQNGRSVPDSKHFAEIYVELIHERSGSFHPDAKEREIDNYYIFIEAEANFRYCAELGSKSGFSTTFANVIYAKPRGEGQTLLEWFDEIEVLTRQVLDGTITLKDLAPHGNKPNSMEDYGPPPLPAFRTMESPEFRSFHPSSPEEQAAYEEEARFREWCEEHGDCDPLNPDSRDHYQEWRAENGDAWWDGLDPEDRDGWIDNMNRE